MPLLIIAMAVPNATFYYLASALPQTCPTSAAAVGVEMFGYGFGFVGMILYIMQAVAPGRFQTAHYALGSGVMQLGFILARHQRRHPARDGLPALLRCGPSSAACRPCCCCCGCPCRARRSRSGA
jgi:hypothetical protein